MLHDAQGHQLVTFTRGVTFFEFQNFVQTSRGVEPLAIPAKANLAGMVDGRVLVELRENWTPAGQAKSFVQGSLLELKLNDVLKDPAHLRPAVVFAPTQREFLEGVAHTSSHVLITTLENVQGRASILTPTAAGWSRQPLPLPDNIAVRIATANETTTASSSPSPAFLRPPRSMPATPPKAQSTKPRASRRALTPPPIRSISTRRPARTAQRFPTSSCIRRPGSWTAPVRRY